MAQSVVKTAHHQHVFDQPLSRIRQLRMPANRFLQDGIGAPLVADARAGLLGSVVHKFSQLGITVGLVLVLEVLVVVLDRVFGVALLDGVLRLQLQGVGVSFELVSVQEVRSHNRYQKDSDQPKCQLDVETFHGLTIAL